jgi:hypothetical protein
MAPISVLPGIAGGAGGVILKCNESFEGRSVPPALARAAQLIASINPA